LLCCCRSGQLPQKKNLNQLIAAGPKFDGWGSTLFSSVVVSGFFLFFFGAI